MPASARKGPPIRQRTIAVDRARSGQTKVGQARDDDDDDDDEDDDDDS
jgi:hypothetical protein